MTVTTKKKTARKKPEYKLPPFCEGAQECLIDRLFPKSLNRRRFLVWFSSLTDEEVRTMMGIADRGEAGRKFRSLSEKSMILLFNRYDERFTAIRARRQAVRLKRKESNKSTN